MEKEDLRLFGYFLTSFEEVAWLIFGSKSAPIRHQAFIHLPCAEGTCYVPALSWGLGNEE